MSGGVDSSVAALLLKREGAELVGLSMHLWDHDRDGTGAAAGKCCTLDDLSVARRAAEAIGIPHYVLDLTERFEEAVVRPFVTSYLEGRTPIPCTACNTEVKFKTLLSRAEALGCDAVATGHYARVETDAGDGRELPPEGAGPQPGPVVLPLRPHVRPARPRALSPRRAREDARARDRPRSGASELGQAGLAGDLLRPGRRDARGLHPAKRRRASAFDSAGSLGRTPRRDFLRRWREGRSARGDDGLHRRPAPGVEDFFE